MNGDGRLDIVSGCYSVHAADMMAPVWVLYRTEAGDFAEPLGLKNEEGQHIVVRDLDRETVTDRICGEPCAHDWDGDGDLDFVIGNFAGTFLLAENVGTAETPAFQGKPEFLLDAAGQRLQIEGHHGAPFLVDWDGDGDVDIVSGSSAGGVQIAENTPTEAGEPTFASFRTLIATPVRSRMSAGICSADTPFTPSGSTRVCVADYDGDGKLDLIVGDRQSRSHPKEGLSVEEASQKQAEWSRRSREFVREVGDLKRQLTDATDETEQAELKKAYDEKLAEQREHLKTRTEFIDAISTGHVWVYLRK